MPHKWDEVLRFNEMAIMLYTVVTITWFPPRAVFFSGSGLIFNSSCPITTNTGIRTNDGIIDRNNMSSSTGGMCPDIYVFRRAVRVRR